MLETKQDMESLAREVVAQQHNAGTQHAQMIRDEVEKVIDTVQEYATEASDYVTSFVVTLFKR